MRYELRKYAFSGAIKCEISADRGYTVCHYDVTFFADSLSDEADDLDDAEAMVRAEFEKVLEWRRKGRFKGAGYEMHFPARAKEISGMAAHRRELSDAKIRLGRADKARRSYVSVEYLAGSASNTEKIEYLSSITRTVNQDLELSELLP